MLWIKLAKSEKLFQHRITVILTLNNNFTLLYLKDDPPPSQNIESSLEEAVPGEVMAEFQRLSFQIVESGTKRG